MNGRSRASPTWPTRTGVIWKGTDFTFSQHVLCFQVREASTPEQREKAGSHRGSLQRIFARGQFAGKLSEARRQNSMQIGSDRFPRFLEQLHLCSRSLWGRKGVQVVTLFGHVRARAGGVTQFLICRCIGCLRCCCWLSPTIQIMFVHVQQLRYLRKHLGRVSCLVGNTRVSTAVDGNSGEVRPVCRCRTLAFCTCLWSLAEPWTGALFVLFASTGFAQMHSQLRVEVQSSGRS